MTAGSTQGSEPDDAVQERPAGPAVGAAGGRLSGPRRRAAAVTSALAVLGSLSVVFDAKDTVVEVVGLFRDDRTAVLASEERPERDVDGEEGDVATTSPGPAPSTTPSAPAAGPTDAGAAAGPAGQVVAGEEVPGPAGHAPQEAGAVARAGGGGAPARASVVQGGEQPGTGSTAATTSAAGTSSAASPSAGGSASGSGAAAPAAGPTGAPAGCAAPRYSLKATGSRRTTALLAQGAWLEQVVVASDDDLELLRVQAALNHGAGQTQQAEVQLLDGGGAVLARGAITVDEHHGFRSATGLAWTGPRRPACGSSYRVRITNGGPLGLVLGMDSQNGYADGAASGSAGAEVNGRDLNMVTCGPAESCPAEGAVVQ